jgi:hypothetical protein
MSCVQLRRSPPAAVMGDRRLVTQHGPITVLLETQLSWWETYNRVPFASSTTIVIQARPASDVTRHIQEAGGKMTGFGGLLSTLEMQVDVGDARGATEKFRMPMRINGSDARHGSMNTTCDFGDCPALFQASDSTSVHILSSRSFTLP